MAFMQVLLFSLALLGLSTAAPGLAANANSAEQGAAAGLIRRTPLFVGGATLSAWAKAAPELFARPEVAMVVGRPGDLAASVPAALARIATGKYQILHVQPDHLQDGHEALDRTRTALQELVAAAHDAGMRVVLARPLSFAARASQDDEALAQWMQAQALAKGFEYADYNHIDFHPELKVDSPSRLVLVTSTLRGALDAAYRTAPGVNAAQATQQLDQLHDAIPDGPGAGPFPAIHGIEPALPGAVVYRPANLALFESRPMPVLLFANGGCMADASSSRLLLTELASHGYVVIAPGAMLSGPGGLRSYPALAQVPPDVPGHGVAPADMHRMLDWISSQGAAGQGWGRYIDGNRIAVAGWSCGGLLAIEAARDPRVKTTIIFDSGVFPSTQAGMPGLDVSEASLNELHGPILYLLGGLTDVAFGNGSYGFSRTTQFPAVLVSRDVGHTGTFWEPNGGAWAVVATHWLDWQLKQNAQAARAFVGTDCDLCRDPNWSILRNHMVTAP